MKILSTNANRSALIRNVKRFSAPTPLSIKCHYGYTHKTKMNDLFKYFTVRGWLVVIGVIILVIGLIALI